LTGLAPCRKPALLAIGTLYVLLFVGFATIPKRLSPLDTVATVDVQRYLGRWYEIANGAYTQVKAVA
jgi:lipocalin